MPCKDKIGGQWRDTIRIYDKVGSVWRQTVGAWQMVGGQWRKYYDGRMDAYLEPFIANPEKLLGGSYETSVSDKLYAKVVNGYTDGSPVAFQVGWRIKNIPPNSTVEVTLSMSKDSYPMNDGVVMSQWQQKDVFTDNISMLQRTYAGITEDLIFLINFFAPSYYSTSTYISMTNIKINGQ